MVIRLHLEEVDQYLYPLYKKDVLEGDLDREFAKEMLEVKRLII